MLLLKFATVHDQQICFKFNEISIQTRFFRELSFYSWYMSSKLLLILIYNACTNSVCLLSEILELLTKI